MTGLRKLLRDIEVFEGELPVFDPRTAPEDPAELFTQWLLHAMETGVREPHAMTLSTAGADGNPTARTLILKDVTAQGWQFASDSGGVKGRDLAVRPFAALTFYWSPLARQVRVRGPVTAESAELSAADFRARGAAARAETLIGRQSGPLSDPAERDAAVRRSLERLEREPDLVPPDWTLHTVRPQSVEFWQGDPQRKHTRLNYRFQQGGWVRELLWP
ncbi:pyridoxal 5'-phosphate synthase [Streptomyces sp. NPDC048462]|uniref:pyridoxine/pyridoxamine 5'-phosphate oxidase n=1 Tax=Streptomyces sp. NPDC048462 TaxID=3365555 RepID=UPI00371EE678